MRLVAAVIFAVAASTPALVFACGVCTTPSGLKILHPKSLDVAVAIRRDLDSGLLKRNPTRPEGKATERAAERPGVKLLASAGAPRVPGRAHPGFGWDLGARGIHSMIKIDLERHWQAGTGRLLEAYLEDFPELGTPETVAPELIASPVLSHS